MKYPRVDPMAKTHSNKSYTILPFSKSRKNITLVLQEGKRKHVVYALLELDVTDALQLIKATKQQGNDISLVTNLDRVCKIAIHINNLYRQKMFLFLQI